MEEEGEEEEEARLAIAEELREGVEGVLADKIDGCLGPHLGHTQPCCLFVERKKGNQPPWLASSVHLPPSFSLPSHHPQCPVAHDYCESKGEVNHTLIGRLELGDGAGELDQISESLPDI